MYKRYWKWIGWGSAFVALTIVGLVLRSQLTPAPVQVVAGQVSTIPADASQEGALIVHVAGAVRRPGVYELTGGSRWSDAIQASGGPLPLADLDSLNLAQAILDGQRIWVPFQKTTHSLSATSDETTAASDTLSINTAPAVELDKLPGIGPKTAAAIVAYREKNGPFRSIADLAKVKGLGPKSMARIRDRVSL
ncbi:MAG: ComEA family DNA-binding protein [Candidatus Margulisiibacteriota bacterium]